MVEGSLIVTVVSVLIALGSLVTAIIVMAHNRHKDTKAEVRDAVEARSKLQSNIDVFGVKLESIDNGVRDLRADNRGFRSELTKMRDELRDEIREIHDEAKHGIELAEAANRRLDRMGAAPDPGAQKKK